MMIKKLYLFLVVACFAVPLQAGIFDLIGFGPKRDTKSEVFITAYDKYSQQKALLEEKLASADKFEDQLLAKRLERTAAVIQTNKARLKDAPIEDYEFLQKKIQFSSDIQQELIDIQLNRKTYHYQIEQTIKAIDGFLKNPDFSDLKMTVKSSYQFQEYQDFSKQLLSLEEENERLKEERRSLEEEIGKINRDLAQLEVELKSKEKDQRALTQEKESEVRRVFDVRQAGEIIDIQKELLAIQKENREIKKKTVLQALELVEFKLFITKSKMQITQDNVLSVERSLYVNEVDLHTAEAVYLQRKSELQLEQVQIAQRITHLSEQRERLKKEFDKLNALVTNPVKDIRLLTEWQIEAGLLMAEPDIIKLGNINDAMLRLEREIELLHARQDLVKTKLQAEDLSYRILNSWYKITQNKLKDDTLRSDEINAYQIKQADLKRELLVFESHEGAVKSFMGSETRALSNIKRRMEDLQAQSTQLIEHYGAAVVKERMDRIKSSEISINRQLDLNGQILKTFSTSKATIKDLLKEIDQVILKLEKLGGIWQRSPNALNLEGVQTIALEARFFFQNLSTQLMQVGVKSATYYLSALKTAKKAVTLAIFIILFLLAYMLVAQLNRLLARRVLFSEEDTFVRSLSATAFIFTIKHAQLLLATFAIYLAIYTPLFGTSNYLLRTLAQLFYLFVFLYLANRFIYFVERLNEKYDYMLFNPGYEKRFLLIGSFLVYSVVALYFFRNAFVELDTNNSLLPVVLGALISIIIRTSIILLISKQFVLGLLPLTHPLSYWLRDMVDRYYLVALGIVVPIIILSDPYIGGYAKFVSYVTWGLFWTALLILVLLWIHAIIKRYAADFFFIMQEDSAKERFAYAKTSYGLFVIVNFAILMGVAVLLGAYIWQHRLPYHRITEVLNFELFSFQGTQIAGTVQVVPFTIRSLLVLASFIVGGYALARAFEHFVLDRLFTLFMLDAGVQNTASRISHYIILVIIFFIALQRVNLGALIPYGFGALLVAVAWALKGPANDFFAYFTILIERSIKIGDYISLTFEHGDVHGVVRKITPRTTVIRKKNSTTIIVPNALVTATSVVNWNYTRGFFAFEDMLITVPYGTNVDKTKSILLEILEQNKNVLKNPAPIVRFEDIVDHGYQFMVRGFLSSANVLNQWDITSDIRFTIVRRLQDAGIELACPVRLVKIKQLPSGITEEPVHSDQQ